MEDKVLTNFWLKQDSEEYFHAFLQARRGTKSICKKSLEFAGLQEMNIPHERSKCCNTCMDLLYGTKTALLKEHV